LGWPFSYLIASCVCAQIQMMAMDEATLHGSAGDNQQPLFIFDVASSTVSAPVPTIDLCQEMLVSVIGSTHSLLCVDFITNILVSVDPTTGKFTPILSLPGMALSSLFSAPCSLSSLALHAPPCSALRCELQAPLSRTPAPSTTLCRVCPRSTPSWWGSPASTIGWRWTSAPPKSPKRVWSNPTCSCSCRSTSRPTLSTCKPAKKQAGEGWLLRRAPVIEIRLWCCCLCLALAHHLFF
jgi:hypothetical protein